MEKRKDYDAAIKRMLSVSELCSYIGLGRNNAMNFGKEIGAEIHIGKRCLYDRYVIDSYFDHRATKAGA